MVNNLEKTKKSLRSIAKRCKTISYSTTMAVLFAMLGVSAFSEDVNVDTGSVISKEAIKNRRKNLEILLEQIKKNNEKQIKGANLKLVKLEEQGEQVVKSPWSSWQFGVNYFHNDWGKSYKGRGDKQEKYPYEGIFEREEDPFLRGTLPTSEKYSELEKIIDKSSSKTTGGGWKSATTSTRKKYGMNTDYGLVPKAGDYEPISSFEIVVSVRPKKVEKSPLKIESPEINIPEPEEPIKFSPLSPEVELPKDPALPEPPTFAIVVGADYNIINGIGKDLYFYPYNTKAKKEYDFTTFKEKFDEETTNQPLSFGKLKGEEGKDGYEYINYTWKSSREKQNFAFKWFDAIKAEKGEWDEEYKKAGEKFKEDPSEENREKWKNIKEKTEKSEEQVLKNKKDGKAPDYIYGLKEAEIGKEIDIKEIGITIDGKKTKFKSRTNMTNEISINSYNDLDDKQKERLEKSVKKYPKDKEEEKKPEEKWTGDRNNQYFFVGGSRAIELDDDVTDKKKQANGYRVVNVGTINLNGILTLGMVSQTSYNYLDTTGIINQGTITDIKEKDEEYIQKVSEKYNTDTDGDGKDNALRIYGYWDEKYDIKLSKEGYVGYKVGLALVPENSKYDYSTILNDIDGKIEFYGPNSIGMYVYLPTKNGEKGKYQGSRDTYFDGKFLNRGKINLFGKESYGMKFAANAKDDATYINEGEINLGKNKADSADGSVAMALMKDPTVYKIYKEENFHLLTKNKAKNKGTINLKDIKNSSGTYVNLPTDIENTKDGKINIDSEIDKATAGEDQAVNIGMRSGKDKEANSINSGEISLNGSYAIGMLTKGAKLENKGIIKTKQDGNISNTIGIVAIDNGNITNSGDIEIKGKGDTHNIGIYLKNSNGTFENSSGVTEPKKHTEVSGNYSTGILAVEKSNLTMQGDIKVSGNAISGIMVDSGSTVTLSGASKIVVDNEENISQPIGNIGTYGIVVKGKDSKFEGKETDITAKVATDKSIGLYSQGKLTLNEANITTADGGINFYADGGIISINGGKSETGQKSLLFFTEGEDSKIQINRPMTATIKGGETAKTRGTAFYYKAPGTDYGTFNKNAIKDYFDTKYGGTLNNLTLKMEDGSRMFVASNVAIDLSSTANDDLKGSNIGGPTIEGENYKTFMLHLSKLKINKSVNLDDKIDDFNKLEIVNSSIENENEIVGTLDKQVALAQENGFSLDGKGNSASKLKIENSAGAKIKLSGNKSTAIYVKRGEAYNKGTIEVSGNKSTAIYLLEDNKGPDTDTKVAMVENTGSIIVGKNSTGVYYKAEQGKNDKKGGVYNKGSITSTEEKSIGIVAESTDEHKEIINDTDGVITLTGDKSIGMYAKGTGTYSLENKGKIKLGDSANENNPSIGMYTTEDKITLKNMGQIESGNKTVGMYGKTIELAETGSIKVGDRGIGIYSDGGNITLKSGSKLDVGNDESVGVFYSGSSGTITNKASEIKIGNKSFGFVINNNTNNGNTLISDTSSVELNKDSVFIYSDDKNGNIENNTKLVSKSDMNYGIYSNGTVTNKADIDFSKGIGNIGLYSFNNGNITNTGIITTGESEIERRSIGMVGGYSWTKEDLLKQEGDRNPQTTGNIVNNGTINVNSPNGIGMYVTGKGSVATNKSSIILGADRTIGIYADKGAEIINEGKIETKDGGNYKQVYGILLKEGAVLDNRGTIKIDSTNGAGVLLKGGIVKNTGTITVSGNKTKGIKEFKREPLEKKLDGVDVEINLPPKAGKGPITVAGKTVDPVVVPIINTYEGPRKTSINSIGMYVDTGTNYTRPIEGIENLTDEADLLIGIEASKYTTSKYIKIEDSKILEPYNKVISDSNIKWNVYSSSLTWQAATELDKEGQKIVTLYMAKYPYTMFSGNDKNVFNFTDGLEQRYGVKKLGSKENILFEKLNKIGNNEEILLYQAFDEMMGHQYANVQQRIHETGKILDKEFKYLKDEWRTVSKDSNKIKVFGMNGEYSTDTAGIIDYRSKAKGVAYLGENETIKLGNTTGWYTGIVQNEFKFKDIGKSKEEVLQAKLGIFKSKAYDDDNSLNWTISGETFVGYSKMKRKFLVVDEIFGANSKYWSYGIGINNELSKTYRLNEGTAVKGYAGIKGEYGRFTEIKEKDGEIRLNVKSNDYYSISPEIGGEISYKRTFGNRKNFTSKLNIAYENELGKVGSVGNKAKVAYTKAGNFDIRGEKEDRKGNIKTDLNVGLENQSYGITVNFGYDTKGSNKRMGAGLRVIF